jgi:hypothetical protein
MHQRIVHMLDWLDPQTLLGCSGKRLAAPERSRLAMAQALVANAVLRLGPTHATARELAAGCAAASAARL